VRRAVTVTAADPQAGAMEELATRLRQAGMDVDQLLGALGVITGTVDDARLAAIEALPGVAAVEAQGSFQIPPPDADVQ
jgi:uncharacterized NAD-dependent epimerase/dehydratase family protein